MPAPSLKREDDKDMEYIASLSYGKDSIVIPELCKMHNLPLDRIVTVDIMATPNIHADLPLMEQFKQKADAIIYKRYGIQVEHITAKKSYEEIFFTKHKGGKFKDKIYGFPMQTAPWCNGRLKLEPLKQFNKPDVTQYLGICKNEPKRVSRLQNTNKIALPAELGYTEKQCYELAKSIGLLSPIYEDSARGGCFFCHNQSIEQLRILRKKYPDYWNLMLFWDKNSPVSFRADKKTLSDFEKRFKLEDEREIPTNKKFRWEMIK